MAKNNYGELSSCGALAVSLQFVYKNYFNLKHTASCQLPDEI